MFDHLAARTHEPISTDCEEAESEIKRLAGTLAEIERIASACVAAAEVYGERDDTHLWREVEDWARAR